jgi:tetratricopeptide (TPR) repeat protein
MDQWIPLALLVLVAVVFLVGVLAVPFYLWQQYRRQHDEQTEPSSIIDMVVNRSGNIFIASSQEQENRSGSRRRWTRHWRPAMLLVGFVAVVALVGLWLVPFIQTRLLVDQFVVLVAPFRDEGSDQPVSSISDELVRVLEEDTEANLVVQQYDQIPGSPQEARQIVADHNADLLIWGEVQSGGFLNDETLQPRLTYIPIGTYAPHAWINYQGRFHLEDTYPVAHANQYINGQAVLPPLVDALAHYTNGSPDQAYLRLGLLLEDYAALDPTLPRSMRGSVLWARGDYADAAAEYQRLGAPQNGPPSLAINLGTILLDHGRQDAAILPEAQNVLNNTLPGLQGAARGTVLYNLGLYDLHMHELPTATRHLSEARSLLPNDAEAEVAFALSEAYREDGELEAAATTLSEAESQIQAQLARVPARLRDPAGRYLQSVNLEQASLLRLAQAAESRGRLSWELAVEWRERIPEAEIESITADLREATELSRDALIDWQRESTINAVARNVLASQIGGSLPAEMELGLAELGQRHRIEDYRAQQNYYLALALIEEGYTTQREPRGWVEVLWGGIVNVETPLAEARTILEDQGSAAPLSIRALAAEGRAFRLHYETPEGDPAMLDEAAALYTQAIERAPERPEGYYGLGQVAKLNGDGLASEDWMQEALARDQEFFPARIALLNFARLNNDWDAAISHLRTLAQQYNNFDVRLALATTLQEAATAGASNAQDRLDEAERRLEALAYAETISDSEQARALVALGRLYAESYREDQAEEAFRLALDVDDTSPAAAYELGKLFSRQGDYAGARQHFLRAADIAQGDMWANANLSIAQLYEDQLGQPDEASEYYTRLLRDDVRDVESLIEAGTGLLQHGETEAALDVFRRAHELRAQGAAQPKLEYYLAESYLELGDFEAAYDHALRVLELTNEANWRAPARVVQGDAVRQLGGPGAFDEARAAYRAALEFDQDQVQVDAMLGLGQLDVGLNDWVSAKDDFEAAMRMAESYDVDESMIGLTYFWYAEALQRQGEPQRNIPLAINYYNEALDREPELTEALLGLAQAHYTQDDIVQATELVEQALAMRSDYPEALLFRGQLFWEEGQEQEALEAFDRAISINDQLGALFYHRGMLLIENDEFDAALDDLQRAIELEPGNSDAYYWLGRANLALDQAREALDALRQSLELDPSLVDARLYQGLAEEALNLIDEARASFETVIQQATNNDLVQRAQEELQNLP